MGTSIPGAWITPLTKPGHEAKTYLFCTHSNYEIKCAIVAYSICRSKSFERIAFSRHTTPFTERTNYAGWMSAFGTASGSTKTVKIKHTNLKENCRTVGQQEKTLTASNDCSCLTFLKPVWYFCESSSTAMWSAWKLNNSLNKSFKQLFCFVLWPNSSNSVQRKALLISSLIAYSDLWNVFAPQGVKYIQ